MAEPQIPTVTRPRPRGRRTGLWALVTALLLALSVVWALAVPLMASPDEPSHVVKAAAVARGEWSGVLGPPPADASRPAAATTVRLPPDLAASVVLPNCYAFQPEEAGDCVPDLPARTGDLLPVETFAGQYPPLYYALVGWPSVVLEGEAGLYAMRIVSALVSAVMLGWGAYRLGTASANRFGTWGTVVALTPMTFFLAGTVNPIGWEITTAFSFWAACLALVSRPGPIATGALVQAAVSGALLVNIRASSPFWALAIVVVVVVLAPRGRLRELVRHRLAPWLGATALVAGLAAVAWILTHGSTVSARNLFPRFTDDSVALLAISGQSYPYLQQMIGNFGWLDTVAPPVTYLAWYAALGALVLVAFAVRSRARGKVALAGLLLGVVAAPFLQFPTMPDAGLIWQGRYTLPLAIGLPPLAAIAVGLQRPDAHDVLRRVFRATVPVLVVGHVASFYWASRRYSEGFSGELFTTTPDWSSPVGYLTGSALYAALCVALGVLAWRAAAPDRLPASAPLTAPAEPEVVRPAV